MMGAIVLLLLLRCDRCGMFVLWRFFILATGSMLDSNGQPRKLHRRSSQRAASKAHHDHLQRLRRRQLALILGHSNLKGRHFDQLLEQVKPATSARAQLDNVLSPRTNPNVP